MGNKDNCLWLKLWQPRQVRRTFACLLKPPLPELPFGSSAQSHGDAGRSWLWQAPSNTKTIPVSQRVATHGVQFLWVAAGVEARLRWIRCVRGLNAAKTCSEATHFLGEHKPKESVGKVVHIRFHLYWRVDVQVQAGQGWSRSKYQLSTGHRRPGWACLRRVGSSDIQHLPFGMSYDPV